jgi:hypothetical protein
LIDGGAVRFDYPSQWIVRATPKYVFLFDQYPPDDHCLLAVSWRRVPIRGLALSAAGLLNNLAPVETRPAGYRGEIVRLFRPPLEAAWTETRFIEPVYGKEVSTRISVARADRTQAMLLMDYRPGNELTADSIWKILMDSLAVGDFIEDPLSGRKVAKRG